MPVGQVEVVQLDKLGSARWANVDSYGVFCANPGPTKFTPFHHKKPMNASHGRVSETPKPDVKDSTNGFNANAQLSIAPDYASMNPNELQCWNNYGVNQFMQSDSSLNQGLLFFNLKDRMLF